MANRYEFPDKPGKCPVCGSERIADILYGNPAYSEELKAVIDAGRIVLRANIMTDDDPKWQCADCKTEMYLSGTQQVKGNEPTAHSGEQRRERTRGQDAGGMRHRFGGQGGGKHGGHGHGRG